MESFRNYLWMALCLCMVATVSIAQRKVETAAEKVMLFIDGAQVTRTKRVYVPAGNSSLLFTGLSPDLDARSMQVSANGKLRITNVNLQYNFIDSVAEGCRQEDLKRTGEILVDIHAPAACTVTFTLSYYVKNAGWFPSYDIRLDSLTKPLSIIYKANIFQHTGEDWKNVALSLSFSGFSMGNVAPRLLPYRLNYGWTAPVYRNEISGNNVSGIVSDATTNEPLIAAPVRIPGTTIGCITDVNGRYSLTMPEGQHRLRFAYVGYIPRTVDVRGHMLHVVLNPAAARPWEVMVLGHDSLQKVRENAQDLMVAEPVEKEIAEEKVENTIEVEQNRQPTSHEFGIKMPYTILSDNKPIVTEIGYYELPVSYAYRCTPKIDKNAFLLVQVTDWNKLNLLEGEANIYFEGAFIGKSVLNVNTAGDTLSFPLGRDRQIVVQRTKENEYTSRSLKGAKLTQTIGWNISVRNNRPQAIDLTLYDQLPVSANSRITVTAEEVSGGKVDGDTGIVTWPLTLQPGEQRNLVLRYKVKSPKYKHLKVE